MMQARPIRWMSQLRIWPGDPAKLLLDEWVKHFTATKALMGKEGISWEEACDRIA